MRNLLHPAAMAFLLLGAHTCLAEAPKEIGLPVLIPDLPQRDGRVINPFTWDDLHRVTAGDDPTSLILNLGRSDLQGRILSGPYPFEAGEADYDYPRYRLKAPLRAGVGQIPVGKLFRPIYNANRWPLGQCVEPEACPSPTVGYRVEIDGRFYDGLIRIGGDPDLGFEPGLTLVEGPFVNLLNSDRPGELLISFETNAACTGAVTAHRPGATGPSAVAREPQASTRHSLELTGLQPQQRYRYQVTCGEGKGEGSGQVQVRSNTYEFTTAPAAADPGASVSFAFASDSRQGLAGEEAFMGVNYKVLSRIAEDAHRRGAQLLLFGGDLIGGFTSSNADFRLQLKAWKKAVSGFWRTRPVYPAMGNHETLSNVFDDGSRYGIALDKWPYASDSAEAVFADEFWNPRNGPQPDDPRRPPYRENVYAFQYGPALFLACNNNYWWSRNDKVPDYGGSPEGYILDDQLRWIEEQLARAEQDPNILYLFIYLQEPVFPAGGHTGDAMWWNGDNRVRAYSKGPDGKPAAAAAGIIEVRNRLWSALSRSTKVAALLTGDEHVYYRTRIDSRTPVGIYPGDDTDGDGKLDRTSPNPEFEHPVWQITAGNAGAPYYARTATPWAVSRHSSQAGYVLIRADREKASLFAYSLNGQLIDHVEDLMAIKADDRGKR
jgi:hypothetical protein